MKKKREGLESRLLLGRKYATPFSFFMVSQKQYQGEEIWPFD